MDNWNRRGVGMILHDVYYDEKLKRYDQKLTWTSEIIPGPVRSFPD